MRDSTPPYVTWALISTCDTDAIDMSTKMGQCCSSARDSSHELERQRPNRPVMTLEQLEYCAIPLGFGDNPMYPPGTGVQAEFYAICHVSRTDPEGYIAILAACAEINSLYE